MFNLSALFGQNFSCGTVAPTDQVRLQSYNAVGFGPGAISTASSIQTTFNIPIKAYVITSNGNYSFIEPEYWMHEAIRWMNQRFVTQNVSFYLCSIDTKENPNYYNLSVGDPIKLTELNNLYGDPQALNVFLVNDINGATGFYTARPNGTVQNAVVIKSVQGFLHALAHEVGHFLGLDHTFDRTGGTIFCQNGAFRVPRLRPNSSCLIPNSTCACLSGVCNAENSGDYISDTPVDPYAPDQSVNLCATGSECSDNCSQTIIAGDPNNPCFQETLVYTPPRNNIMSYHSEACINSFSPLQLELMKRMLNNGADYAFLRDQILPTCQSSSAFASQGKISYFFDADGAGGNVEALLPFPGLKVKITAGSSPSTNTTNNQGIYSVNQSMVNGQTYTFGPDLVGETATWNESLTGVSTADLIQVQRYLNILRGFNNYNLIAADADGNGIIQSADINTIRDVILNRSPNFGAVPSWRFVPESLIFGDNSSLWLSSLNINIPTTSTNGRTSALQNDWVAFNNEFRPYLCSGPGCTNYFAQINFTAPYKPVSNTKAWSYVGVKTGDVNYSTSISPTQFRNPDISTSYNSGPALRGGEAKLLIKKGESFTVLVTAKPKGKAMNILGYQMGLKINPELAELSGVSPGEVRKFEMDAFALERQEKGVIKTLWYDNEPIKLSGEKVLFEVTLNAKTDISDLAQAIGLSPEALQPEFVSDQEELLAPEIGFKVKNGQNTFSSIKVYPNPTQAALSFEIDFTAAGDATIMLNDQYGNRLQQAFKVQKGRNTLVFEQTNGLLPGVLSYMINHNGSTLSGQVVKHK